ncbi:hypothetical protein BLS_000248 [Venturia inaequalis]|uniref:BZIP domain-containing protein n=1 Tax=Venturia inaequalis TaxID=5025 RepID=A0A8H3U3E0_VENIN|nr:hypothetical protein BLS_000248 [Venturia inaequalis]
MGRRKTKTHEEDLSRVRENQRRHRARVKNQVATLEEQLAEKEALLAKAEERIAELTAALEAERSLKGETQAESTPTSSFESSEETTLPEEFVLAADIQLQQAPTIDEEFFPASKRPCEGRCPQAYLATTVGIIDSQPSQSTNPGDSNKSPNKIITLTGSSSYTETVEFATKECLDLDSPRSGESTTLCITAYNLIDQQNFRGLEIEDREDESRKADSRLVRQFGRGEISHKSRDNIVVFA